MRGAPTPRIDQLAREGLPTFPKGIINNVVGFTTHGAHLVNVWSNKQLFEDFLANRLTPALGAVGGLPLPQVTTFDVYKNYAASPGGEG